MAPSSGQGAGLYDYGIVTFISVILVVTVRVAFEFRMVTAFTVLAMAFCILFWWFLWIFFSSEAFLEWEFYSFYQIIGTYDMMSATVYFWFCIIAVSMIATGMTLLIHGYESGFKPSAALIAREIERLEASGRGRL